MILKIFNTEEGIYVPKGDVKKLIRDSSVTGFFFTTDYENMSEKEYNKKHIPKYIVQVKN